MKKHSHLFILTALFFITACNNKPTPNTVKLACNINTFDAPISCISQSPGEDHKLYLGQEDGCFIINKGNNSQTYSINSNRRIYDILEYNKDSLFIGTRDAGLKLLDPSSGQVRSYAIKDKHLNYSVYSIARDRKNQILYLGTSNGLYQLNLQDKDSCRELPPIKLRQDGKSCGINKVLIKKQTLYVASERGLYILHHTDKGFSRPILDSATNNISIYNDTVYALLENAIVKVAPDQTKQLMRKGKFHLYVQSPDKAEWFVTSHSILYQKGRQSLTYELPDGISLTAKQVGLIGKDFLYLACKEALYSFALRQHSANTGNNVVAVSDKKTGDSIYFITDDLKLHQYKFIYNHPEYKSRSLGLIKGLDIAGNDIVKFIETKPRTFYLATRTTLYKIRHNKAEKILHFSDLKGQDNITALYYSPIEKRLYLGTRKYLGIVNETGEHAITTIPVISKAGIKDTVDAYITGICENSDSLYAVTLNKGLYGKSLNKKPESFRQIRDLSDYESTYDVMAYGKDIYLHTSQGLVNKTTSDLLPIKHVKAISGVLEKNPNEGFFILYYYGLSFNNLGNSQPSSPLFSDLAFHKSCIAVNGRKAVLGCKSGLFLFDGKSELTPISTEEKGNTIPVFYWIITLLVLVATIVLFYLLKRKRQLAQKASEPYLDEKRIISDNMEPPSEQLQEQIQAIDKKVKSLFDTLGNRRTEGEENLRQELKQDCLNFADQYPELSKLSFMKRRGRERYFITLLLLMDDIDANVISRVLDVDQSTVTRHKYNVRKEIEQLYPEQNFDDPIIGLLYERVNTRKK